MKAIGNSICTFIAIAATLAVISSFAHIEWMSANFIGTTAGLIASLQLCVDFFNDHLWAGLALWVGFWIYCFFFS